MIETTTTPTPTPTTTTTVINLNEVYLAYDVPISQFIIRDIAPKPEVEIQKKEIQKNNTKIEKWREDALSKALESAEQKQSQVSPDDSRSSIQTTGKSGWCYIGDDQGLRTCSEIGVNDVCMSGDVFPSQSVCINPKLRA